MASTHIAYHIGATDTISQNADSFCHHHRGNLSIWVQIADYGAASGASYLTIDSTPAQLQALLDALQKALDKATAPPAIAEEQEAEHAKS